MLGWPFVQSPTGDVPLELIRAVKYILHRLEQAKGASVKHHTYITWENGGAVIQCNEVDGKDLMISEYDPICFPSWLDDVARDWIGGRR